MAIPVMMQLGVYHLARPEKPPKLAGPKYFHTSLHVLQEVARTVKYCQDRLETRAQLLRGCVRRQHINGWLNQLFLCLAGRRSN
jgi:hypothetical protein